MKACRDCGENLREAIKNLKKERYEKW